MTASEESQSGVCPPDEDLYQLLAGDDSGGASEVEDHVGACERCAARLEQLAGSEVFQQQFVDHATKAGHDSVELSPLIEHLKSTPEVQVGNGGDSALAKRFPAGSDLDGFRIEGLIARGGMGVVLRAHDPHLKRDVAIKLLDPSRASSDAAGRFLSEARAVAAIDHENVLPVFTTGNAEDLPYLVMPFVDGETLAQRVEREGALDSSEVVRVALAAGRGLDAAHRAGLVHRDVKPANILMEAEGGRIWIADFGLARAVEDPGQTRDGVIAGTPQFMSPEQADGAEADERSDLFSLGAVIFFMLTGKPPFVGESSLSVLRQVAESSPVWPKETLMSTPSWLAKLAQRLMSKRPEDRPRSAREVVEELETSGRRSLGRRRALAFAAAGVALVAAGGAGVALLNGGEEQELPFVVGEQSFASIGEALEAAANGDVIELDAGSFSTSDWPTLDRDVTLKGAPGGESHLIRDNMVGPVLDVGARVRLDGLRIEQPLLRPEAGEHLPPLVVVGENAKLEMASCTLARARPGKPYGRTDGADGGPPPAVEVLSGGELTMRDCEMASAASFGVAVRDGGRAVLEDSVIGCEFPFFMDGGVSVEVRRCSLIGIVAVMARGEDAGGRLLLDSNQLLTIGSVLWTRDPLASTGLTVESTGNLYVSRRGFGVVGWRGAAVGTPDSVSVPSLAEWREFCGEPEGVSAQLTARGVARLVRDYSISELHPAPDLALERIRPAVTDLQELYPQYGPGAAEGDPVE